MIARTVLAQDAALETYFDVEQLIRHTIWDFIARHGGDFDELLGLGHELFMLSYETHTHKGRASFSTWLRMGLWHAMLDHLDRRIKHQRIMHPSSADELPISARADHSNWWNEVSVTLSTDARYVAECVIYPPKDIIKAVRRAGRRPINYRHVIKQACLKAGWHPSRVKDAFHELRSVLQ